MRGYKVFNPDWTCKGFQYAIGKIYKMDEAPKCCVQGFHFCTELVDCFSYYCFDPENKVAEIEAIGEIDSIDFEHKHCTNKIKIMREISWEEVLRRVNIGKACSGYGNSGDRNSGLYNSGYFNSGNRNSGDANTGDWNSGHENTGDWNSGYWNMGNHNSGNNNNGNGNSGNYNSGNCNSGDWNKASFSSGCFNTNEQKIFMFNKPSDWTYSDWLKSDARCLLNSINKIPVLWIYLQDMTDREKTLYPESNIIGGYLKEFDTTDSTQIWWNNLSERNKSIIKNLPNFDANIFKEITEIQV